MNEKKIVVALNTKNQKKRHRLNSKTLLSICSQYFACNFFLQTAMLHSQMCFDLTSTFIARLFALTAPSSDIQLNQMCLRFFVINSITTYLNDITLKRIFFNTTAFQCITTYLNDITSSNKFDLNGNAVALVTLATMSFFCAKIKFCVQEVTFFLKMLALLAKIC